MISKEERAKRHIIKMDTQTIKGIIAHLIFVLTKGAPPNEETGIYHIPTKTRLQIYINELNRREKQHGPTP